MARISFTKEEHKALGLMLASHSYNKEMYMRAREKIRKSYLQKHGSFYPQFK